MPVWIKHGIRPPAFRRRRRNALKPHPPTAEFAAHLTTVEFDTFAATYDQSLDRTIRIIGPRFSVLEGAIAFRRRQTDNLKETGVSKG